MKFHLLPTCFQHELLLVKTMASGHPIAVQIISVRSIYDILLGGDSQYHHLLNDFALVW
jgi:hypothetical protein